MPDKEPASLEEFQAAMTAIVDGAKDRSLTDEEVERYEKLEASMQAFRRSDEIRKRNTAWTAPRVTVLPGDQPKGDDVREHAFEAYLRTGRPNADLTQSTTERSNMAKYDQTITTTGGGYLIPPGFVTRLIEVMKNFGGVRRVAEPMPTSSGQPLQYPTNDDTANTAALVAVGSAPGSAGADLVFGQVTLGAWSTMSSGASNAGLRVPFELAQDAVFDIAGLVSRKLGTRVARLQAVQLATGTGSSQPLGLFWRIPDNNLPTGNFTISGGVTAATIYAALLGHVHKLDPDYRDAGNCSWLMSDATAFALEQIVDGNSRPLLMSYLNAGWQAQGAIAGAAQATDGLGFRSYGTLLGYPVIIDQAAPPVGNASAAPPGNAGDAFISFGDHREAYVIRDVQDATLLADPYTRIANREIQYFSWARMDATIQNAAAYKLLAGYHA